MRTPYRNKIPPFFCILLLFMLLFGSRTATPDVAADESASPQRMPGHFLTGPNEGEPLDIALAYLRTSASEYGLTEADVADVIVTANYLSDHNGVTHIHTRQRVEGIEINEAVANLNIAEDGSVISMGNRYVSDAADKISGTLPAMDAMTAVEYAANHLLLEITAPLVVERTVGGVAREVVISDAGISRDTIPAKLMYQPDHNGNLRLAWEMVIYELDANHWWHMWIDADTGTVLEQYDWVTHDDFGFQNAPAGTLSNHVHTTPPTSSSQRADGATYNVFPYPIESPIHGDRAIVTDPASPVGAPFDASPFGWHDDDGVEGADYTTTRGNNTHAYQDLLVPNVATPLSDAEGGDDLVFDFAFDQSSPFVLYKDAAVTNLFYWTNLNHDIYYQYGFNEVAGNFQENNYGRGGVGGDYVFAEAQDGSGTDNANFATPADGSNPRMQMYVFVLASPGETKDGDFDAGIIAHEYGHGISIRLTGGPSDVGCMNHSEREGEGWSDWLGLVLTTQPEHTAETPRGVGAFALSQPPDGPGIRNFPYTTDMSVNPQTYADIANAAVPHGVGSIWATMIWDLYWAYVDKYGYDANVYNAAGTAGNQRVIQLIMDGMKMQVCDPTFTEARDAILAAEQVLTGGENECMIWDVFARRGLGFSADAGSETSATDGTEAFDLPSYCISGFEISVEPLSVCSPANGVTAVNLSTVSAFGQAIALSAENLPTNATASFDPDTINTLPGSSSLTIGNTGNVTPGTYFVDVVGTAISETVSSELKLNIANAVPSMATLATPADGLVIDVLTPLFTWQAADQASSYKLEIATDYAFTNIIYTKDDIQGTSFPLQDSPLVEATTYYWRLTANNDCGEGLPSAPSAFSTSGSTCESYDALVPLTLLVGSLGGTSTISVADDVRVTDVNLQNVAGVYDSIDSLLWTVTSPTGTSANVLRRDVVCNDHGLAESFDIGFDDEAAESVENAPCPPDDGTSYVPSETLSVFDEESSAGTWSLTLTDAFINHAGVLNGWSLEICSASPADYSDSASSYGVAIHNGSGALRIGTAWDGDNSSAEAQDDDTDDGVAFDGTLEAGEAFAMTVDASGAVSSGAWLTVWFDWNNDGDFADAGEMMFDQAGTLSANVLNGTVPVDALLSSEVTYRVRLYDSSSDPSAEVTGGTTGGEVTDGSAAAVASTPTVATLQSAETAPNHTTLLILVSVVLLGLVAVRLQRES